MKTTLPVIEEAPTIKPNTAELLPFAEYDRCIVSYSGGKDSTALVYWALERFPKSKIELWHQDVDGGSPLMDWPVTPAYVRAVAAALGVRIRFQWKVGGFEREMLRENALTAPTQFELEDGSIGEAGGTTGKPSTRLKFPQVSADLSVRYCSPYLKIDVAAKAINNDPALATAKLLFLTGERREESSARSRYAQTELHRCHNQKRTVHQHRPVIDWAERSVWEAHESLGLVPHPAYRIGYGRLSCQHCIFQDANQAATNRLISPAAFAKLVQYEQRFGVTVKRNQTLTALADSGTPYVGSGCSSLVGLALDTHYTESVLCDQWELPSGAYKRSGGPN